MDFSNFTEAEIKDQIHEKQMIVEKMFANMIMMNIDELQTINSFIAKAKDELDKRRAKTGRENG